MPTIKAKLVAFDVTDDYAIDEADRADIVKIEDVYLFDANRRTHCCELTPSYWFVYLYTNIEFHERFYDDVETEEISYRKNELYQRYAYCLTEDCYVHCGNIRNAVDYGEYPYRPDNEGENERLDDYDGTFEAIRENACGNCPV